MTASCPLIGGETFLWSELPRQPELPSVLSGDRCKLDLSLDITGCIVELYSIGCDNKPRLRCWESEILGLSEAKIPTPRGTNIFRRGLTGRVLWINQSAEGNKDRQTERERRTVIAGLFTFLWNPRSRFLCTRLGLQLLILDNRDSEENVCQNDSDQRIQDQSSLTHVAFQVRTNLVQVNPLLSI